MKNRRNSFVGVFAMYIFKYQMFDSGTTHACMYSGNFFTQYLSHNIPPQAKFVCVCVCLRVCACVLSDGTDIYVSLGWCVFVYAESDRQKEINE